METIFEYKTSRYHTTFYKDTCDINSLKKREDENWSIEEISKNSLNHPLWEFEKGDDTEEVFVKNYGNPLCFIQLCREIVTITKKDDKISIKYYYYVRTRREGKTYFTVKTSVEYLTYNLKKNIMYVGYIRNYHKKKKFIKKIKISNTSDNPLNRFRNIFNGVFNRGLVNTKDGLISKNDLTNKVIHTFVTSIPGIEKYDSVHPIENRFYKFHLESKGVKLPNNWNAFIFLYPQPNKKHYIKHDFKYIDTFMSLHNLKGNKVRRVLHKVDLLQPSNLETAFKYYGQKYIMSQPDEILEKIFKAGFISHHQYVVPNILKTKIEIDKSFEIFKLVLGGNVSEYTFMDHVDLYRSINRFEPLKWNSYDYESFNQEHVDWTEKNSYYTKGTYERIYSESFVKGITKEIKLEGETFLPMLLTKSDEYNMESLIQSNCVKTYIKKAPSVIISLRKDSEDSKERATIEYRIRKKEDVLKLERVQTLGRFNNKLSDKWSVPIKILDENINKLITDKKFELPKLIITYFNGESETDGVFLEGNQELQWNRYIE